jgi:hypothetical protein
MLDLDKWSVYCMALCVAFYCVDSEKDLTNADDRHNCKLTHRRIAQSRCRDTPWVFSKCFFFFLIYLTRDNCLMTLFIERLI